MPPETLREALEGAWDEEEKELEKAGGSAEDAEESLGDTETEEEDDESDGTSSDVESEEEEDQPDGQELEAADNQDRKRRPPVTDKPPNSWTPKVREHWAKLPQEVRAEIAKRELEIQQGLSRSGDARKFADQFAEVVRPFEGLIRAQNSTPLQAVQNLMTTAAGLSMGSPAQKAQIVANIIQNYGVDIATLDKVLVGQDVSGPNDEIAKLIDQRLAPVQQLMQQVENAKRQNQQRSAESVQTEISQFSSDPANEHFEAVRNDMADLMEIAAKRGQQMTLADAYKRACAMNGLTIQPKRPTPNLSRKRQAASSVQGKSPSTSGKPKQNETWRDALSSAFDQLSE